LQKLIKKDVDLNWSTDNLLPLDKIEDFEIKYDKILKAGFDEYYAKNVLECIKSIFTANPTHPSLA